MNRPPFGRAAGARRPDCGAAWASADRWPAQGKVDRHPLGIDVHPLAHERHGAGQQGRVLVRVAELIDTGGLCGIARDVLSPINAANLRGAHRRIGAGSSIGKLVLAGW